MKRWKVIALGALGLLGIGVLSLYVYLQGLADLRTDYAKTHGASAEAQEKGRALLPRSLEELGGADRWQQLREQAITITYTHDWYHPLLKTFFMPLEFSGQKVSLLLRPGHLDARLSFLDGERSGTAWGLRAGQSYRVDSTGAATWEPDGTIEFHLPGYRFFFFVTFLLSEAERITFAGTEELNGKTYDLVYATWGQWEPHAGADQYLLWIERESLRVDFVQSTVREMVPRSIVGLALSDYRDVLGIQFPFSLKIVEDIRATGEGMHHIKVLEVQSAAAGASELLDVDAGR